jgi:hypothetical protein
MAWQPSAAQAQIWIGQIVGNMVAQGEAARREQECMTGTAMPEAEIAEARTPALATMRGYFADAGAGKPISARFNLDKNSHWTSETTVANAKTLSAHRDPLAQAGLMLDAEPIGFVRAGDSRSALGQWAVRDASGVRAGLYTATFTRKRGIWALSTLTLSGPRNYADPVVQYCHKPGDVLPYRVDSSRMLREFAEKRLAKHERKLAEAQGQRATPENTARIDRLTRELEARRSELAAARDVEAKAAADAQAAAAEKAAAIAALAS